MKDPLESATYKFHWVSMKLAIYYIVCVNISAYAKFEKDPSNGCAPHSMDHVSSGTLSIHIY